MSEAPVHRRPEAYTESDAPENLFNDKSSKAIHPSSLKKARGGGKGLSGFGFRI